ncbi:uncharacterized protein LOC114121672 isoform X2 [Aphis gossypii]|uniref:uncharacterized protein LOC114121672 isoform X2 n=1 Tax=Aphis gossypii TaxID=80765 RepID=UPI0021595B2D|nr:uncharacterized protein LOC114121672 isoform X2 [Aphis gossypii]
MRESRNSEMSQVKLSQKNKDPESAISCLTTNNFSVPAVELNTKKKNTALDEMRESWNRIKMLKNKSKLKKTHEPKADVSIPVMKPNTYNETIDLDRVKEIQKRLPFLQVIPESLIQILMTEKKQDNMTITKTNVQNLMPIKQASATSLATNNNFGPELETNPIIKDMEHLLLELQKSSEMIQELIPIQTNTDEQNAEPDTQSIKHTPPATLTTNVKKPKTKKKNIALKKNQNREMAQTKVKKPIQMNTDDQTAEPATAPIKNEPAILTINNVSLPQEKPKSTKESIEYLLKDWKKIKNNEPKQAQLTQNNMKTPIAKPTTMLIKHNPASLKSNNVFLPLDKPKITTKIERLDEIRKLWNDNHTIQYKSRKTSRNKMQNAKLACSTKDIFSLLLEKPKSMDDYIQGAIEELRKYEKNYHLVIHQQNTINKRVKSNSIWTKHSTPSLTTSKVSLPVDKPKKKNRNIENIDYLLAKMKNIQERYGFKPMIFKPTAKIINKLPIVRRVKMSKKHAVPSRLTSISMPMNRPKIMKNNISFNSSGTLKNGSKPAWKF